MKNKKRIFIYHSPHFIKPRITVVGEYHDGLLKFAVARCSLKDRFVRKTGRLIAMERIVNGDVFLVLKTRNPNSEIFHEYANVITNHIWNTNVRNWDYPLDEMILIQ